MVVSKERENHTQRRHNGIMANTIFQFENQAKIDQLKVVYDQAYTSMIDAFNNFKRLPNSVNAQAHQDASLFYQEAYTDIFAVYSQYVMEGRYVITGLVKKRGSFVKVWWNHCDGWCRSIENAQYWSYISDAETELHESAIRLGYQDKDNVYDVNGIVIIGV